MKISVIGSGSWGTAFSHHLGSLGHDITMWSHGDAAADGINREHRNPRYLMDCRLPDTVHATTSLQDSVADAQAVVFVTPSNVLRTCAREIGEHLGASVPAIVLSKGIEQDTCALMLDVVAQEIGHQDRVACLSGPNLAGEIARGLPAAAVIAARDIQLATFFQGIVHSDLFRAYTSDDVIGVEVCGAAKNVVAIACGIAHGMGLGDNTAALLMTRGLAEMSRLVEALGGNPITCMGLAGMGDLVATCTSPRSRNFSFGESFAHGESIEAYRARTHMVVEGYYACASIRQLMIREGVEAPLTCAVHDLLYGNLPLRDVMASLSTREPRTEFYGIL